MALHLNYGQASTTRADFIVRSRLRAQCLLTGALNAQRRPRRDSGDPTVTPLAGSMALGNSHNVAVTAFSRAAAWWNCDCNAVSSGVLGS